VDFSDAIGRVASSDVESGAITIKHKGSPGEMEFDVLSDV
jgi:hypothetical protein